MLSKELELTLNLAFKDARDKRHEFMTVEHLLLSLLDNASKRNLSDASAAFEISSRKKISLFEYKEWIINCNNCFTSVWKPWVCLP